MRGGNRGGRPNSVVGACKRKQRWGCAVNFQRRPFLIPPLHATHAQHTALNCQQDALSPVSRSEKGKGLYGVRPLVSDMRECSRSRAALRLMRPRPCE